MFPKAVSTFLILSRLSAVLSVYYWLYLPSQAGVTSVGYESVLFHADLALPPPRLWSYSQLHSSSAPFYRARGSSVIFFHPLSLIFMLGLGR
ncbi:hypothetical protein LX36DRAFT_94419 [Colletotrichum falcatum]|nr:hypothetical protein LX36DRAFT_94419 [Colletotrichum falcatum]